MEKNTERMRYNGIVIQRLMEKYGVSRRFITMSIKGERSSETASRIKSDYQRMLRELKKTINSL